MSPERERDPFADLSPLNPPPLDGASPPGTQGGQGSGTAGRRLDDAAVASVPLEAALQQTLGVLGHLMESMQAWQQRQDQQEGLLSELKDLMATPTPAPAHQATSVAPARGRAAPWGGRVADTPSRVTAPVVVTPIEAVAERLDPGVGGDQSRLDLRIQAIPEVKEEYLLKGIDAVVELAEGCEERALFAGKGEHAAAYLFLTALPKGSTVTTEVKDYLRDWRAARQARDLGSPGEKTLSSLRSLVDWTLRAVTGPECEREAREAYEEALQAPGEKVKSFTRRLRTLARNRNYTRSSEAVFVTESDIRRRVLDKCRKDVSQHMRSKETFLTDPQQCPIEAFTRLLEEEEQRLDVQYEYWSKQQPTNEKALLAYVGVKKPKLTPQQREKISKEVQGLLRNELGGKDFGGLRLHGDQISKELKSKLKTFGLCFDCAGAHLSSQCPLKAGS